MIDLYFIEKERLTSSEILQISQLGKTIQHNENVAIKYTSALTIVHIVESNNIDNNRKQMILAQMPKRKLEYSATLADNKDTEYFILELRHKLYI